MSPKLVMTATTLTDDDPVWRAAMAAPVDDTPDTEEELAVLEAAERGALHWVSGSVVSAEIARRARDEQ